MHIAATNIVNINVIVETIPSWRRQLMLERRTTKLIKEADRHSRQGEDQTFSALDEDDFQTVVAESKLGHDLFSKKV
ncbi:hypothetical protein SLEP1_g38021 [Rubroshorea leprosula]|uniref:Uncharacterized protein n=1 Tax=Rubroshorea leprosula TaxID=152421 RepID=A0AAV5KXF1_9ROSI|nr:hypothetical protein SLEP1_g38021 [Rubroshorea leprosula]